MKKRINPCKNMELLPQEVAKSKKANLSQAEKNLLATLCAYQKRYSLYAADNNGWFYKSQASLFEESNLSPAQGKRVLLKLINKRLIERRAGTNHRCTHYRIHPAIIKLMSTENNANEPLAEIEQKTVNEPLVENGVKNANEPLAENNGNNANEPLVWFDDETSNEPLVGIVTGLNFNELLAELNNKTEVNEPLVNIKVS